MKRTMKRRVLLVLAMLGVAQAAHAVITFNKLADDLFVISHRIKVIGSRGRAMKLVYQKAASLCVAAGFEHYEILEQESNAGQQYESANASIRVRFFFEGLVQQPSRLPKSALRLPRRKAR